MDFGDQSSVIRIQIPIATFGILKMGNGKLITQGLFAHLSVETP